MKDAPGTRDYDWWLLVILATICALGVIEIYSATHGSALVGMHVKQVRWIIVGTILMFALSRVDYHIILDQAPILYLIGVVALVAVLLVGHTRFGAKRWIPVLGEFLQVSELVKLIIIIVLARFFAEVRTDELSLQDLIKAGLIVGVPLGLILKQPDLGTALVLVPMLVVGAYLAGLQWQHAAIFSLAGVLLVGSVFYPPVSRHILKPYQRDRITSFLHPEDDAKGSGYQLLQSKIAVGSGGFWGKGFGNGSQNQLGYIPVRYSDFIMSAWAEEQGFKGVLLALGLYMALLLRLVQNAQRAKDRAGMFLVMGVAAALGFHVLVNVAMVIGAMPVTGIPLPLMSYGGSATLFVFLAIGLVMNVRLRRFVN
ncbi:MAG TPA: rod shape-determining protein RodA [Candidatus Acidoferrum sp.]|jgi:rod shape determining protein RodA|nr:rod shape-determining protein RodA [Candidatus Acidoferrum sp.]